MHIAIVGCGQLSQMLAQAGIPLGHSFSFLADPEEDTRCVDDLGGVVRISEEKSIEDLYTELGEPDCLTVEKEQVDLSLIEAFLPHCPVHPNSGAFAACQHRLREKQLLDQLNIPCAPYYFGQPGQLESSEIQLPVVVKSCREGYDGKNQWVLRTPLDVSSFDPEDREDNYIVEQWIPFDREISQVSVRNKAGEIRHYPLAENQHENGILKESVVPAPNVTGELEALAQGYMKKLMEALDYVGVMAMECFVTGDQLLVNELAPRVHNSGHWSQEGSETSQFENHVRAVADMPLGPTESIGITGMVNLIGVERPADELITGDAKLHWYGKVVRPGRKLGHINFSDTSYGGLSVQIQSYRKTITG